MNGILSERSWMMNECRRSRPRKRHARIVLLLLIAVALLPGCASAGRLGEYDFRGKSVAVVSLNMPRPEILTNEELDVSFGDPLLAAIRIGADVVKEVEAARARPRLDRAAQIADVGGRMMDRVLGGVVSELRAVPAIDAATADFEVEVQIKRFGIDADQWTGPAHFFIESEVVLRDGPTGQRIWKGKVKEREPLSALSGWSPAPLGPLGPVAQPVNDVVTAVGIAALSEEQMIGMLEALSDFSADKVLRSFRKGLEKSRG